MLVELVTIIAAIYVSPKDASIQIHTDSQNIINTFQKIANIRKTTCSNNPIYKLPYSTIWLGLFEILSHMNIHFSLKKVKAHDNDKLNN